MTLLTVALVHPSLEFVFFIYLYALQIPLHLPEKKQLLNSLFFFHENLSRHLSWGSSGSLWIMEDTQAV